MTLTLAAEPSLMMRNSHWVIESSAQVSDEVGRSLLVIQSLTREVEQPFGEADRRHFTYQHDQLRPEAIVRATSYFEDRLGLACKIDTLAIGWPGEHSQNMQPDLLASWLARLHVPDSDALAEAILQLPLPLLASPPEDWKELASLVGQAAPSPFLLATGFAAWGDRPVLALLTGTTGVVLWLTKPFATNLEIITQSGWSNC